MWYAVADVDECFAALATAVGAIVIRYRTAITIPQIDHLFIEFPLPEPGLVNPILICDAQASCV